MRTSKYLLYTNKHIVHSKQCISHTLMLQAGLIRKISSGLYIWLPTGLRVLQKIKHIIRYEMNNIGGLEILFPIMQNEDLWHKSNRFNQYGKELIKLYDRNNNCFILSPTYEEIITDFAKKQINSYKKLPILLYQIQSKFRDEMRPRAGIIRSKEFIMKDAYSFHMNKNCLENTYHTMYKTYIKIFKKMQLNFHAIPASSGFIGGKYSHEFQALSKNGEDKLVFEKQKKKNTNLINEINKIYKKKNIFNQKKYIYKNFSNNIKIEHIKKIILQYPQKIIKIFLIKHNNQLIGLAIRYDHILNINKIKTIYSDHNPMMFIQKEEIKNLIHHTEKINFPIPFILDTHLMYLKNIIPIVIINNIIFPQHILNQKFKKIKIKNIITLKNQKYKKKIHINHAIEIGHIFNIGKKYSKIINFQINTQYQKKNFIYMGCYGIGVTRLIASIIEQNHDNKGIIWPINIAPFQVIIIPMNIHHCSKIKTISEKLYNQFKQKNIDVLLEDRNERKNIIFSDTNLIGIPHIIIINSNTITNNTVEYQKRINIHIKHIIHIKKIIMHIINDINNHM
ncbi:Proline--tRNA ligase [Buchnera aphidicola (Pterocallis alni)]|uniref:proline--tRNA ligase n=1 Tax=Buchnera aphidicola TaxID=9 RepID=UPI003463E415